MKKYVAIFVSMLALMFVSTSCQLESFNQYDLVGVWENDDNAGEFWRYRSDLTGSMCRAAGSSGAMVSPFM